MSNMETENLVPWLIKRKTPRIIAATSTLALCLVITAALDSPTQYYLIAGGCIGAVSSLIVIISYALFPIERGPPLSLLFWRAVCDLGVAIRFLATPGFDILTCGSPACQVTANVNGKKSSQLHSSVSFLIILILSFLNR